ncbi:copper homeostasis protein CutC [Bacillus sp. S13(2024)]|uniref:copper homeostasis protein CutC n=1 Tax=unclassified Bacillus (in: firmicutes) TaxID=185979 RepID=UPI003D23172B
MLEVIATCLEDAKRIERGGGERIELITAFTEGGLTPSYALIKSVIEAVTIPVHVMIRPHAKSFLYSKEEIELMKEDIRIAKQLGATGVVLGVLNENHKIDGEKLGKLLEVVDEMNVTFHRAIDELTDLVEGVKILRKFNKITHILTSGGKGKIEDNIAVLRSMNQASAGQIQIVVGSGVTNENVQQLLRDTGSTQAHVGTAVREGKSCFCDVVVQNVREIVKLISC